MKKVYKFCISIAVIAGMALYLAQADAAVYSDVSGFLNAHLNNPQQCLYIITIFSMCALWVMFVPYLEPCFYLRVEKLTEEINVRNIKYSVIYSLLTFALYFVSAVIMGYKVDIGGDCIITALILCLFYFMCFELSTSIYLITGKKIVSILSLYAINLSWVVTYFAINFSLYNNGLPEYIYYRSFNIYVVVTTTVCLIFNEVYLGRKEIV